MTSIKDLAEWAKSRPKTEPIRINRRVLEDAAGHRVSDDALHILAQLSGRQWEYDPAADNYRSKPEPEAP